MSNVKLGTDKFSFDELEQKYRNFIAPGFRLLIDGKDAVKQGMAVPVLTVDTTAQNKADSVHFTVANAYNLMTRDFEWLDDLLVPGKPLEVHMGYTDLLTPLFYGYITAVNVAFPSSGTPEVSVTGMDLSFKMMRGRSAKSWANQKISDVVKKLGQQYGATDFVIDATAQTVPVLTKNPKNDYQFILELARSLDYEFFVVGKTLYFRKKNTNKTPLMTLSWGKHLFSFRVEQNIADQVTKVKVRSWDAKKQKVVEAASSSVSKIGTNTRTGADLLKQLGEFEEHLYVNAEDMQEAKTKADAAMPNWPHIVKAQALRLQAPGRHRAFPFSHNRSRSVPLPAFSTWTTTSTKQKKR